MILAPKSFKKVLTTILPKHLLGRREVDLRGENLNAWPKTSIPYLKGVIQPPHAPQMHTKKTWHSETSKEDLMLVHKAILVLLTIVLILFSAASMSDATLTQLSYSHTRLRVT